MLKRAAAAHLAISKRYPRLGSTDASVPSPRFHKLAADLTRKKASLLVQLRMGHVPLNQHLVRIRAVESPLCPTYYKREETVRHYLLACPAYASQRRSLHAELSRDADSVSQFLAHPKAMGPLFRFIVATRRWGSTFDGLNTERQHARQSTP